MSEPTSQSFRWAMAQAKKVRFTLDVAPAAPVGSWQMAFYVRRRGTLLVTKLTGTGITCTNPTTGVWEVSLAEEDSTDADKLNGRAGLYDWAFWRTDDQSETPLAFGTCTVYRTAKTG